MGSGGTTALVPPGKFCNLPNSTLITGADTQSRTGDLTLTKGALYQLSHISTEKRNGADTQNRTGDLTLTKGALYQLSHISAIEK